MPYYTEQDKKEARTLLATMEKLDSRVRRRMTRGIFSAYETMTDLRDAMDIAIRKTKGDECRILIAELDRVEKAMRELTSGILPVIVPPDETN